MEGSIFEIFTQVDCSLDRSQGGLGIGLTLARHLAQLHGGTIEVSSPGVNQGSEFIVRLPVHYPEGHTFPEDALSTKSAALDQPFRVLVVDDNRDAAEMVAMGLRLEGYQVQTVHDGPTVLSVIPTFDPHLVLLDIG